MSSPQAPAHVYDGYLFDLDGTLYLGDELLPGSSELVSGLRDAGARVLFLSNNPTRDASDYAAKLSRLGIPATADDVLNPVVTMPGWLRRNRPDARAYVIGSAALTRAVVQAGIHLTDDPKEIDVVVASYDRAFDYRKLQIAFDALRRSEDVLLVTTNMDAYCPLPGGAGEPDSAAVVAAIEACTGHRLDLDVGKPGAVMAEAAMERLGLRPDQCVMVGDRLYTDVALAQGVGMDSALVLTGETTREMVDALAPDDRPTWVLEGAPSLLPQDLRTRDGAA
ncbi:MAG: HAD-IIA family hydrolase [Nocardioidaceae bacterium]|nr:HAD-IIA family hydrolase [Nocardioidaceae bacterium]